MIFAFTLSRLLVQFARCRLENGSSLGTLEQLIGSLTLGSAFKTHLELRALNLLIVALLSIWICSPLGGQALLRMLDMGTRPVNTELAYFDTFRSKGFARDFKEAAFVNALFSSKLIQ